MREFLVCGDDRVITDKAAGVQPALRILYVSYDGIADPLGRSQILPYLAGLASLGHRITVLSCEKPDRLEADGPKLRGICSDAGLGWHPLTYHKRPPVLSSALDANALRRAAIRLHGEQNFDIVHCRSYIPARVGLAMKQHAGVRFLFDMRGFWPEEKVEGGNWNLANPIYRAVYRYFKRLEARLLREADHIVSLTEAGKDQLLSRDALRDRSTSISVIPCCVDFGHFPLASPSARAMGRARLGLGAEDSVVVYLGSLGSWYMLDEMLDFFGVYATMNPKARLLFITQDETDLIERAAAARGIGLDRLFIHAASREDVPRFLAAADLGIFFIMPLFSKKASSPTKMGEMLAVGLPIVANSGIGDVDRLIRHLAAGVTVSQFDRQGYAAALESLNELPRDPEGRRARASSVFDVNWGIEQYHAAYLRLAGQQADTPIDSKSWSKRLRNSSLE